jgi:hypothetical protein
MIDYIVAILLVGILLVVCCQSMERKIILGDPIKIDNHTFQCQEVE